jgi:hypothetical protein
LRVADSLFLIWMNFVIMIVSEKTDISAMMTNDALRERAHRGQEMQQIDTHRSNSSVLR